MRVLFLESHPMWIHGLPNGFRDLGHEVLVSGPLTKENIPAILTDFKPDLIGMMGWTEEHTPEKLDCVSRHAKALGIPLFFWATEDPTHAEAFTLPLIRRLQPDFVFTICPANAELYNSMGMKAARLDFGYHRLVHHRTEVLEGYRCAVAVVANAYPHILGSYPEHFRIASLQKLIVPLVRQHIRVDFWGRDWDRMSRYIGCDIPAEWLHGYIQYTEANKVYSSADIVIGLQNHATQLTQRTYETLGSGGFLLTCDTPEVRRVFQPGADLVVSSSPEETVSLVNFYAARPEEREKIRKQGEASAGPHSYQYRARQILDTLKQQGLLEDHPG